MLLQQVGNVIKTGKGMSIQRAGNFISAGREYRG